MSGGGRPIPADPLDAAWEQQQKGATATAPDPLDAAFDAAQPAPAREPILPPLAPVEFPAERPPAAAPAVPGLAPRTPAGLPAPRELSLGEALVRQLHEDFRPSEAESYEQVTRNMGLPGRAAMAIGQMAAHPVRTAADLAKAPFVASGTVGMYLGQQDVKQRFANQHGVDVDQMAEAYPDLHFGRGEISKRDAAFSLGQLVALYGTGKLLPVLDRFLGRELTTAAQAAVDKGVPPARALMGAYAARTIAHAAGGGVVGAAFTPDDPELGATVGAILGGLAAARELPRATVRVPEGGMAAEPDRTLPAESGRRRATATARPVEPPPEQTPAAEVEPLDVTLAGLRTARHAEPVPEPAAAEPPVSSIEDMEIPVKRPTEPSAPVPSFAEQELERLTGQAPPPIAHEPPPPAPKVVPPAPEPAPEKAIAPQHPQGATADPLDVAFDEAKVSPNEAPVAKPPAEQPTEEPAGFEIRDGAREDRIDYPQLTRQELAEHYDALENHDADHPELERIAAEIAHRTERYNENEPPATDVERERAGQTTIFGPPDAGAGERIVSAAIQSPDTGHIYTGQLHSEALDAAFQAGEDLPGVLPPDAGGYMTSHGRFVSDEEAHAIAEKAGQVTGDVDTSDRMHASQVDLGPFSGEKNGPASTINPAHLEDYLRGLDPATREKAQAAIASGEVKTYHDLSMLDTGAFGAPSDVREEIYEALKAHGVTAPIEDVFAVEKPSEPATSIEEEVPRERSVRPDLHREPESQPAAGVPAPADERAVERPGPTGTDAGRAGGAGLPAPAAGAAPGAEPLPGEGAAPGRDRKPGPRAGGGGSDRPAGPGRAGPGPAAERAERAGTAPAVPHVDRGRNYVLTPDTAAALVHGGQKAKAVANVTALRLLKQIEGEGRPATQEEQEILARYTGWGGIPQIFDADHKQFDKLGGPALRELLTDLEYAAARASTPNAHYTSPDVVRAVHDVLARVGFKGGRILEPSMGAGYFLGLTPEKYASAYHWTGVELDSVTGRIGKLLYPASDIRVQGFEKLQVPDGYFDAAIGNVPFGDYKVHDPRYNKLKLSIHNYFFRKAVDVVRPGGIVAFITSRYTLDAQDPSFRNELAKHADLIGAIRLPQNAFRGIANTEVVTDLIVLQVREPNAPKAPFGKYEWQDLVTLVDLPGGAKVNRYFGTHPSMTLGTYAMTGSMYGSDTLTVEPDASTPLAAQLQEAVGQLPAGVYAPRAATAPGNAQPNDPVIFADESTKENAYVLQDGKILQRRNGVLADAGVPAAHLERVSKLITLRDLTKDTLRADLEDMNAAEIERSRKALVKAYDAFVKTYGPVNKEVRIETSRTNAAGDPIVQTRYPNLQHFDDGERALVGALEDFDAESGTASKADLLLRRVFGPRKLTESVATPGEALPIVLAESGRVDLKRVAQLSGVDEAAARAGLKGLVFEDPKAPGSLVHGDVYLTGDVKEKLATALEAAADDARYQENVDALQKVQPDDLKPSEISVRLGSPWVPTEDIRDWIAAVLDASRRDIQVHYNPATRFHVRAQQNVQYSFAATNEFGTVKANAIELISDALNLKHTVIYYPPDENGHRAKDAESTLAAQEKQQKLKDHFAEWVWQDGERAQRLAGIYNERFNRIREYKPDGSHLTLPGAANVVKGKPFALRPHQKNAIWRYLTHDPELGNLGLFHVVGSGKTYTAVAIAMEAKRLGLAKKPMQIVPNHMLEQFSREAKQLYPTSRLLLATKEDFAKAERQAFIARAATNDWDMIIMTQRSFESIPMSNEFQAAFMRDQLAELEQTIREAKEERAPRSLIKQIERAKKDLEARIEKMLAEDKKDRLLAFEQMGIDLLLVDEADAYKNLYFTSKMEGVAAPNSQRAFDLFLKTMHLDQVNPGRGIVFMTGTPIANQVAEMYTMQRYLQLRLLKQRGLDRFDDWAGTFGETVTAMELKPDNSGFRLKTRFAKYTNMGELAQMFRSIADIQSAEDLDLPRPKLKGGEAEVVSVKATGDLKAYIRALAKRGEAVQARLVDPTVDNWLKITSDGRHAALDMRLVDKHALDLPDSKLNRAVERIHQRWQDTKDLKGTQLVFLDISTPGADRGPLGGVPGFSAYDEIREKLIDAGVPKNEVRFIHDAKTDEQKRKLFQDVRAGRVRILMGSTEKMGAGTNVQDRLVALHHLDAPWRPRDIEQRNGRILRQGNVLYDAGKIPHVSIETYVTEGSFDGYIWQGLERKAGFIQQAMKADASTRSIEDVDGMEVDWATIKAIASGNPKVKEKAEVDAQIQRLEKLKRAHADEQFYVRRELQSLPGQIAEAKQKLQQTRADAAQVEPTAGDAFTVTLNGQEIKERTPAAEALFAKVGEVYAAAKKLNRGDTALLELGRFAGFDLALEYSKRRTSDATDLFLRLKGTGLHYRELGDGDSDKSILAQLEHMPAAIARDVAQLEDQVARDQKRLTDLQEKGGGKFKHADKLNELRQRSDKLEKELAADAKEPTPEGGEVPAGTDEGDVDDERGESEEFGAPSTPAGFGHGDPLRSDNDDVVAAPTTIGNELSGEPTRHPETAGFANLSAPEVMRALADVTAAAGKLIELRVGRMGKRKGVAGFWNTRSQVIRTRSANDIAVAAHEVAHALESLLYGDPKGSAWVKPRATPRMQKELIALGKALYGTEHPAAGYKREGWAEYVRIWLTESTLDGKPGDPIRSAPTVTHWFETRFAKDFPKVWAKLVAARDVVRVWRKQGARARAETGIVDTGTIGRRLEAAAGQVRRIVSMEKLVEMAHPLYKLSREAEAQLGRDLAPTEDPFFTLSALRQTHAARTRYMVEHAMIDLAGNHVGPGLHEIRELVQGRKDDFTIYLWARRAIALATDPKGPRAAGISLADARQLMAELDSPAFQLAAGKVYGWNDGVLNYAAEASPTFAQVVENVRERDPGDYVPLQREFDELDQAWSSSRPTSGGATHRSPVRRLKGSARRVKDPFPVMIAQTARMLRQAHERLVLDQVIKLSGVPGMGHLIEEVPPSERPAASATVEEILRKLKKDVGLDVKGVPEDFLGASLTFFAPMERPNGKDPIVPIYDQGHVRWYYVKGTLYDTLKALDVYRLPDVAGVPILEAIGGVPAAIMRAGTTGLRASFGLVWNPIRDFQTLWVNTQSHKMGALLFGYWLKSFGEMAVSRGVGKHSDWVDVWLRLGGEMAQPLGQDQSPTRRAARELFEGPVARTLDVRNWFGWFQDFVQFPEGASRLAELRAIADEVGWTPGTPMTLDQSLQFLLAGKQVTTDFTAAGEFARVMNRIVPFHNAGIQGPRANLRAARRNPGLFAWRMLSLGLVTLYLWWRNKDKDWYRVMDYRDRFLHWHFEIRRPDGTLELIKIPRAFEVGMIGAALPEMAVDAWYRNNPAEVTAWFKTLADVGLPNIEPTLLQVAREEWRNRQWPDRPIVGKSLEEKPPAEQFTEYTTAAAKAIGTAFDVSPMRVDHIIRGIGGPVAHDLLDLLGGHQDRERTATDLPLVGRLVQPGGPLGLEPQPIRDLYDATEHAQLLQHSDRTPETPEGRRIRLALDDAAKAVSALLYTRRYTKTEAARRQLTAAALDVAERALAQYKTGEMDRGEFHRAASQGRAQRRLLDRQRHQPPPTDSEP